MKLPFFILSVAVLWGGFLEGQVTSKTDRTAVLQYGIETEVLDLVRSLRQEKNLEFRDLLIDAYDHARNDDLKEALLLFFLDQKDKGLEDRAIKEIADPEKKGNSVLLNAVSYLTEIESQKVRETLVTLTSGKNKILALASIRSLGKLGAKEHIEDLLKLYRDAETDPNYKPDLIWAFGEMKAGAAVELLLKEYEENESQPLLRRSILEALGKIGDTRAWPLVEEALANTNTDLRSSAVATLSAYPGKGNQVMLLTAALRDAQGSVRQAAAQAAKASKPLELKEMLNYRVKKDPEPKVRIAALQTLAVYDDGPATVISFLSDRKTDFTVWREALNLSLDKKYKGTFEALKKVLEEELKEKSPTLSPVIAGAILPQRETYRALFGILLDNKNSIPSRSGALRALAVGKFTEYESVLKTMAIKDSDPGVRTQASTILKDWSGVSK